MAESLVSRAWWLHPLLIAAFFVLFLFAVNIGEQVSLDPLIAPLGMAMAGAAALLAVSVLVSTVAGIGATRAALIVSLALMLFFSYGHIWPSVEPAFRLHRYQLLLWGVLALGGTALVLRATPAAVRSATAVLNVVALLLVALNVIPIAQRQVTPGGLVTGDIDRAIQSVQPNSSAEGRPDIWYLVFDRYAGQEALERIYGFDNRKLLDALRQRGFYVVEHATSNYLKTSHSLASTLSMDYLDADALASEATAPDDWTPLYRRLQSHHAVEELLHAQGYEYIHLGVTTRGATFTNSAADRVFLYTDQTEFSAVLAETTALVALDNSTGDGAPAGTAGLRGRSTLYQLNTLEQLAQTDADTPRFVLVHFLLPHPPYVFNSDGSWVTPAQRAARTLDEAYLQQVLFANMEMLRLMDLVIGDSADEGPVVLIQADEGPFPDRYADDELGFAWQEATDEELLEKFSILAAYRVPGSTPEELGLTATTTPVNSFRIIFNALFDTGLPLVADRNYVFTSQREIYDLVDVTDRVEAVR